jgi:hypothetical protein
MWVQIKRLGHADDVSIVITKSVGVTDLGPMVLLIKQRSVKRRTFGTVLLRYLKTTQYEVVYGYLKQRRICELASTCDQLRTTWGLNRVISIGAYSSILVGRIWHVRRGFVGVHVTRIEWVSGDTPYARDERRTLGACKGGAVWLGSVSPNSELVVGEGIETTLSAMILWNAKGGAATLGTSGLKSLVLPQAARRVVIAADNDALEPNRRIGIGLHAARAARRLWLAEDPAINVDIRLAPSPQAGATKRDWNDVLMGASNV